MPGGGQALANMILSSATLQADLIQKNGIYKRQMFEQHKAARDQAIQQIIAEREQKKAERKARKKKNATLGAVAVAAVLTGGAAAALAPAAGAAGALATTGATLTATGLPQLVATGATLTGLSTAIPSTAALFAQGAFQELTTTFLGGAGSNLFQGN